ncbi:MAG: hypothetical protein ACLT38_13555 [Akkermansia sp.]
MLPENQGAGDAERPGGDRIYRASQHTPSPDLFIPLVIGQELLGYEDDVVQAVALRVEDPYHVETMLAP